MLLSAKLLLALYSLRAKPRSQGHEELKDFSHCKGAGVSARDAQRLSFHTPSKGASPHTSLPLQVSVRWVQAKGSAGGITFSPQSFLSHTWENQPLTPRGIPVLKHMSWGLLLSCGDATPSSPSPLPLSRGASWLLQTILPHLCQRSGWQLLKSLLYT